MPRASRSIMRRPSIRHDGRVLAVGTDRGVVLWDLARGTELAFLPIGDAWLLLFEPSGDLLTSGSIGVQRWPVRLDPTGASSASARRVRLPLPAGDCGIAEDRSGRIVALARYRHAHVLTPERTLHGRAARRLPLRRRQPGRRMVGDRQSSRPVASRSGASSRRHGGGRAADRSGGQRSLQPRWEMADDEECRRAGSGQSAPGARRGRSAARVSASPPTAACWWSRTRTRSSAWSRPRPAARSRGSKAPTCATRACGDLQPRRVAAGGDHQ